MVAVPTPFASREGRYAFMGSMSLENAFVEVQGNGGKSQYVVLPCDGMVAFSDDADTPMRGQIYMDDLDCAYIIRSSGAWKLTGSGTETKIGTLPGVDKVQMTRNKKSPPQVTILCNAGLYYIEDDQVRIINDPDLPTEDPVSLATLGEFTLLGYEDGRVFYSTQSETTQYAALDFFTAEQSPDKLLKLYVNGGELFIFSKRSIENWVFQGANVDSPFVFRTLIQRGLMARDSVTELDGTLFWVGSDEIVYRLDGYTPKRVSNHAVERLIHDDTSSQSILGFSWVQAGHSFYTLKGSNWTRTYDVATQEWHSRKSRGLDVWRAQYAFSAWNKVIVGDDQSGKTFYLDPSTYTEDSGIITWKVRSPHMHAFPTGGIVDRLSIDFLTGQGVTVATAQGYEPLLMLSYSDDGGNTWSTARHLKMGRQGQYDTRIRTRRLGKFREKGRVWELSVSDPVGRGLASIDAAVRPLAA